MVPSLVAPLLLHPPDVAFCVPLTKAVPKNSNRIVYLATKCYKMLPALFYIHIMQAREGERLSERGRERETSHKRVSESGLERLLK